MIMSPNGISPNMQQAFQDLHMFRRAETPEADISGASGFSTITDIIELSPEALAALDLLTNS